MIAEYLMVDEETLDYLIDLDDEDLTDRIFEIEESKKFLSIDIDKIWDALHCFLTNVSATEPIEDNKLSEAIVGINTFSEDEDADFISFTENDEIKGIIDEMEKIDFDILVANFDPLILKKNKVYPKGIWDENKEQLIKEFKAAFDELLKFYKKALETQHHVIVSIL
ncbi:protein of unknown function [Flavobacterium johnsoniae]|nr:protein of unknown function [Flavobacterium johnsoniae]